jgi:hypothetical protein
MASCLLRLSTQGHLGPLKLQVNILPRGDGDFQCMINRDKDINEDNYIWWLKNKSKMILYPKKAFDIKFHQPVKGQQNNNQIGLWQPPYLFI